MRRITAVVLTPAKALGKFKRVAKAVVRGERVEPTIGFDSIATLNSLLSAKRLDLLRHVAQHPGLSIRRLAIALERDYKRVHTDVTELEAWGLLERDDGGRLSAPYDEIVIRAPLRAAA
jgi:predicted transcriptional regulator